MAIQPVRIWPDPSLTRRAPEVAKVDAHIPALVADLFDTMYDEDGIGLAANQIGVAARVLVLDLDPHRRASQDAAWAEELAAMGWRGPLVAINPRLVRQAGHIVWEEGCLSVPGITDKVRRAEHVVLAHQDVDGEAREVEARGLFAVAIQHEIDHLDGKVFIDRLSRLKREIYRKRLIGLRQLPAAERQAQSERLREEVPHGL